MATAAFSGEGCSAGWLHHPSLLAVDEVAVVEPSSLGRRNLPSLDNLVADFQLRRVKRTWISVHPAEDLPISKVHEEEVSERTKTSSEIMSDERVDVVSKGEISESDRTRKLRSRNKITATFGGSGPSKLLPPPLRRTLVARDAEKIETVERDRLREKETPSTWTPASTPRSRTDALAWPSPPTHIRHAECDAEQSCQPVHWYWGVGTDYTRDMYGYSCEGSCQGTYDRTWTFHRAALEEPC
jgi:hypothetical protein